MLRAWLGPLGRALLVALAWAVAWAPLGVLTGMIIDSDGAMDEPWVAIGAYVGFLCALLFSIILALADRRRALEQLPFARAAAWGALSGLLLMGIVMTIPGTPNTEHALWRGRFAIAAAVTLLSAVSAAATVMVARKRKGSELSGVPPRTV